MDIEKQLVQLARERDSGLGDRLASTLQEGPDRLRRQLRAYLHRQIDLARLRLESEKIPVLEQTQDGIDELRCERAAFASGARLDFSIEIERGKATGPSGDSSFI